MLQVRDGFGSQDPSKVNFQQQSPPDFIRSHRFYAKRFYRNRIQLNNPGLKRVALCPLT
jgi:hypothetical protein